jgi:hypothetical protein
MITLFAMSMVVRASAVSFVSKLLVFPVQTLKAFSQWRYLLLLALGACELSLVLNQNSLGLLKNIFPYRVPYQHIAFLHQLFIFCSVAITQVVPVLFPDPFTIKPDDPRTYTPFIERISALSKVADRECKVSPLLQVFTLVADNGCSVANASQRTPLNARYCLKGFL